MIKNTAFPDKADQERREWTVALAGSILLHVGLCMMITLFSYHQPVRTLALKSIDVDLSYLPAPKEKPEAPGPAPSKAKTATVKKKSVPVVKPAEIKKVSLTPKKKAAPVKKKETKPDDTIDKALKRLEKDMAATPQPKVDPLAERIKQLEKETRTESPVASKQTGTGGQGPSDSAYDVSLLERYRHNVGMEIREQWAFAEHLAAGQTHLATLVTFEVLPDGEIRGVRITRRSGNDYMDSSATMAVVKASPVRPHPPGLNKPFIEVNLKFTPKGLD